MFLRTDTDHADRPALVDGETGCRLSQRELSARVLAVAASLASDRKQLIFLIAANDLDSVVAYLGAIEAGHALAWLEPSRDAGAFDRLVAAYRPDLVLLGRRASDARAAAPGYESGTHTLLGTIWRTGAGPAGAIHPDLACLLSTSGSTGSRKLVRLARDSLVANARAIVAALGLSGRDVAVTTTPLAHAFGLSVLNSHLAVGGTLVLSGKSILQGDFWRLVGDEGVTTFPGVPFTYELLRRLGPERVVPASVTAMTQAGGRLALDHVRFFRDFMSARGGRFRVMYGQTEATARITVWPDEVPDHELESVGRVIPGGALRVHPATGELLYRGPNVMMGYADDRDDLVRGAEIDELGTGDLGYVNDEGFVFLTGRARRIAKIAGRRISLDEVEGLAGRDGVAAIEADGRLAVFVESGVDRDIERLTRRLSHLLALDRGLLRVRSIARLPRTSAGKTSYASLEALVTARAAARGAVEGSG